ncbi:MAG: hypothetical protein ABW175_18645 [Bradyrhizobium sp.]
MMAYAIFKDGEKLSRTFPTREEALKKATEAGLVDAAEDPPALEDNLTIKPCSPDPETSSEDDLDWTLDQTHPGDQRITSK